MLFNIFLVFFISLFLLIFLLDAIPQFYTWQSRIKMGRFTSEKDWENKVLQKSVNWLEKTPTIKLTDNSRFIFLDILRGNYKRNAIQSWQEAALVLGLSDFEKNNPNEEIQNKIKKYANSKLTKEGIWKIKPTESDHVILAYAFLNTKFLDHEKFRPAFEETYKMILSLKGEDGTIAYKKYTPEFRFVDTIGFICPFLVNFGLKFNQPEAIDLAVKQITEFEKYGMMELEKIPCHTYNIHTKIPTGLFGWGRGLGWFLIGLADSYNALPKDYPQKIILEKILTDVAKSLLKFQQKEGSFSWLIFDEKSRKDSSTVATVAYFCKITSQIPEISENCYNAHSKCLNYLKSVTRRDGAIDFSQGDTKSIGVYSQNFDIFPFTQGFTLRNF